jgi:hypothetical protein
MVKLPKNYRAYYGLVKSGMIIVAGSSSFNEDEIAETLSLHEPRSRIFIKANKMFELEPECRWIIEKP